MSRRIHVLTDTCADHACHDYGKYGLKKRYCFRHYAELGLNPVIADMLKRHGWDRDDEWPEVA